MERVVKDGKVDREEDRDGTKFQKYANKHLYLKTLIETFCRGLHS